MIGWRDRRSAYAVVTALVAAAFAFPALAAAESAEEAAVVKTPVPSPLGPWGHWTSEELEEAEPLPVVTLPGSPTAPQASPTVSESPVSTVALRAAVTAQTAAIEGVEVSAAESTEFPNSVNGKLFGEFQWRNGENRTVRQKFSCSASVVDSPRDSVIVTAGHCAIDPETGAEINSETIFIPGYRKGTEPGTEAPFGEFRINSYATPPTWESSAAPGLRPNEGADIAFMQLRDNSRGESIEQAVKSSMGIAFDQPCDNTYTQFGYPADWPYSGDFLYSHTSPYAGADTEAGFRPVPMKIASDFTRGASGGPWITELSTGPTVLSVTAYGYENQPGYLYGPYFGESAKKAYGVIIGKSIPAAIEESCTPLPSITPTPTTPGTPATTPTPTPIPTPEVAPTPEPVTLKVTRVRRRANGSAVLTAKVSSAGKLNLRGAAVRFETVNAPATGKYRLVVAAKGAKNRRLRRVGKARVGVKIAFRASGKTKHVSRKIALSRRSAARTVQRRTSHSH